MSHDTDVSSVGKVVNVAFLDKVLGHLASPLPTIMRVGFVGLGHLVDVFFLLDSGTSAVGGIDDLTGKLLFHGLLTTEAAVGDEPSESEGLFSLRGDLDWDLIVGSADTTDL